MSTWWVPFSTQAFTTGSPKNLYCIHKPHFNFRLNCMFYCGKHKHNWQWEANQHWKPIPSWHGSKHNYIYCTLWVTSSLCITEGSSVCMCVRHGVHGHMLWCGVILTGPTQLRIITACLHRDANESGSATSATMISTSELSSGLPACEYRQARMGEQVKTHTQIIITVRQLSGCEHWHNRGTEQSFVMFPQLFYYCQSLKPY